VLTLPNRRGGRSLSGCQVARSEHPLRRCFASAYIDLAELLLTMGQVFLALTWTAAIRRAHSGGLLGSKHLPALGEVT
jgi:hypothetical protein